MEKRILGKLKATWVKIISQETTHEFLVVSQKSEKNFMFSLSRREDHHAPYTFATFVLQWPGQKVMIPQG